MSFGFIGLHFRYRLTIHRRHWPYAKNTRFLDDTLWFWALKLTKIIILHPKLDKFSESEGHLELSWALNRDPWGFGDPQWAHSGPKWAPSGFQMEPTRAKEAQAMDQRSPSWAKRVQTSPCWWPKMGKGGTKKQAKRDPKAIMHVFRIVKIHRGKSTFLSLGAYKTSQNWPPSGNVGRKRSPNEPKGSMFGILGSR